MKIQDLDIRIIFCRKQNLKVGDCLTEIMSQIHRSTGLFCERTIQNGGMEVSTHGLPVVCIGRSASNMLSVEHP